MRIIELDEGWNFMQVGIGKLKSILEGRAVAQFSSEEYMMLYTYPFVGMPGCFVCFKFSGFSLNI